MIYRLSTVSESNDRGSWFGYQIEKVGTVEDANLYDESKAFSTAAVRGDVEAKPVAELEVSKEAPTTNLKEDDIPF